MESCHTFPTFPFPLLLPRLSNPPTKDPDSELGEERGIGSLMVRRVGPNWVVEWVLVSVEDCSRVVESLCFHLESVSSIVNGFNYASLYLSRMMNLERMGKGE